MTTTDLLTCVLVGAALVAASWLTASAWAWMRDVDAVLDGECRDDWLADGEGERDE